VSDLFSLIDKNCNDKISYKEFLDFYYLIPAEQIRHTFDVWNKNAIDIGESVTVPEEKKKGS
jgi:hypothetical protein